MCVYITIGFLFFIIVISLFAKPARYDEDDLISDPLPGSLLKKSEESLLTFYFLQKKKLIIKGSTDLFETLSSRVWESIHKAENEEPISLEGLCVDCNPKIEIIIITKSRWKELFRSIPIWERGVVSVTDGYSFKGGIRFYMEKNRAILLANKIGAISERNLFVNFKCHSLKGNVRIRRIVLAHNDSGETAMYNRTLDKEKLPRPLTVLIQESIRQVTLLGREESFDQFIKLLARADLMDGKVIGALDAGVLLSKSSPDFQVKVLSETEWEKHFPSARGGLPQAFH